MAWGRKHAERLARAAMDEAARRYSWERIGEEAAARKNGTRIDSYEVPLIVSGKAPLHVVTGGLDTLLAHLRANGTNRTLDAEPQGLQSAPLEPAHASSGGAGTPNDADDVPDTPNDNPAQPPPVYQQVSRIPAERLLDAYLSARTELTKGPALPLELHFMLDFTHLPLRNAAQIELPNVVQITYQRYGELIQGFYEDASRALLRQSPIDEEAVRGVRNDFQAVRKGLLEFPKASTDERAGILKAFADSHLTPMITLDYTALHENTVALHDALYDARKQDPNAMDGVLALDEILREITGRRIRWWKEEPLDGMRYDGPVDHSLLARALKQNGQ